MCASPWGTPGTQSQGSPSLRAHTRAPGGSEPPRRAVNTARETVSNPGSAQLTPETVLQVAVALMGNRGQGPALTQWAQETENKTVRAALDKKSKPCTRGLMTTLPDHSPRAQTAPGERRALPNAQASQEISQGTAMLKMDRKPGTAPEKGCPKDEASALSPPVHTVVGKRTQPGTAAETRREALPAGSIQDGLPALSLGLQGCGHRCLLMSHGSRGCITSWSLGQSVTCALLLWL